jgi:hypothetical protein
MFLQQFGLASGLRVARVDLPDAGARRRRSEGSDRQKYALRRAGKSLFDDRLARMRDRRDVDVDDVFLRQRLADQHARVGPESRVDIPTRQIAARVTLAGRRREDQQHDSNDRLVGRQDIAVARKPLGDRARRHDVEGMRPVRRAALLETAHKQVDDGLSIFRDDLAAAHCRSGIRRHLYGHPTRRRDSESSATARNSLRPLVRLGAGLPGRAGGEAKILRTAAQQATNTMIFDTKAPINATMQAARWSRSARSSPCRRPPRRQ